MQRRLRADGIRLIAAAAALAVLSFLATLGWARAEEGIALGIVYDTSGSMKEPVRDLSGKLSPKYVIASHALQAIAQRIQVFITNSPGSGPRKVDAGVWVFDGNGAKQAVPYGRFDASAIDRWARSFSEPNGGTPLGNALAAAGEILLDSARTRKHLLIITDGINTIGKDPAAVIPRLSQLAEQRHTSLSVHFIAFDVEAKVFDRAKKAGARVVSAADEAQLKSQLTLILEQNILLEDEEPPKKK